MSSTLREASKDTLLVNEKTWHYYSLPLAEKQLGDLSRLPKSLKVLMENLLRWQDGAPRRLPSPCASWASAAISIWWSMTKAICFPPRARGGCCAPLA